MLEKIIRIVFGGGESMTILDKTWLDSVSKLKGVGPAQTERFKQLGITSIKDLMFHFPFRYEDVQVRELDTIMDQEKVTLKGIIVSPPTVNYYGNRRNRLTFRLAVTEHDIIQVVFFNQHYLAKSIELGQELAIYGKWESQRQSLIGMKIINVQKEDASFSPVYRATKGLSQKQIITAIERAFETYGPQIQEVIPSYLNDKYQMIDLKTALYQMHFPNDNESHNQAKRKIIFFEFFMYQWRLQKSNQKTHHIKGVRVQYDVDDLKSVIQTLPFDLTQDQKQAINDICYDLLAPYPMRRMLQGDVGSGKTLVAFIAMIATVQAGYQTALMVPTEILAKQHVESFNALFEEIGLRAEILVSAMATKEKNKVVEGLKTGRIRIVVGTHALIQDQVTFKNLALVIIDEQHRFGVNQRQRLLEKSQLDLPINLLQMTATPIPRSLALSIYGEMSVSTIKELPSGRKPIQTRLIKETQLEQLYHLMREELEQGHQIYYVLPLIESSEHMEEIENVLEIAEKLKKQFPEFTIDVLHGQLDKKDQRDVMSRFSDNKIQIIVATTMVEVGVNVPNATMMIIQSAERFGLAQLHQLRGRVGRSDLPSYCYLIANPTTEQGKARMKIMLDTQDGFLISHEDMKIRGIGDVLGHAQSGLPEFHYANIFEDQKILEIARLEVVECLKHPYWLSQDEELKLEEWSKSQVIEL